MPFITVGTQRINYVMLGKQGLPVIFVHGAGSSHLLWWNQMRALEPFARPLALDLPGHGRSDLPGRDTITAYADVILGLLDALALERAVVVGHSMGGAIVQMLALDHPDRVAGLVLIGTGARLRVMPAVLNGILQDFNNTVHLIIENGYAPGLDPVMRQRAEDELRACSPQITHDDFVACNAFDIMSRVGEIRAPTIVICGREDKMAPPKYSEFLASKIPHAHLILLEGAGHFVMLEQADAVSGALVEFVRGLEV